MSRRSIEAGGIRGERGSSRENAVRGSKNVKLQQRISQVTIPIHQRNAMLIQAAAEDVLDCSLGVSREREEEKEKERKLLAGRESFHNNRYCNWPRSAI